MATAYTTRYGSAKEESGVAETFESVSGGFGDDVGLASSLGDGIVTLVGGGSIVVWIEGDLDGTTGSGKAAIGSSEDVVSIVIWVVAFGAVLSV